MTIVDATILIRLIAAAAVLFCVGMVVLSFFTGNRPASTLLNLRGAANRRVPTGHKRAA